MQKELKNPSSSASSCESSSSHTRLQDYRRFGRIPSKPEVIEPHSQFLVSQRSKRNVGLRRWEQLTRVGLLSLPFIPRWDVSGVVEAVRSGVTKFKKGDEVCGPPKHQFYDD